MEPDAQPKRKRKRRAKTSKVVPTIPKHNDKANAEPLMLSHMAACLLGTPSASNIATHVTGSLLTTTCSPARTHRNDKRYDVNSQGSETQSSSGLK